MGHTVVSTESLGPYPCNDGEEKLEEPGLLLEEGWFFGNSLLDGKPKMLTSLSDPSASSDHGKELVPGKSTCEETYGSIKKLPGGSRLPTNSTRAPSLERQHQYATGEGSSDPVTVRRKSRGQTLPNNLPRAPSVPTSLETQEVEEEETEFSMGKLIRQASLSNTATIAPRTRAAEGVTSSSGISRREQQIESFESEDVEKSSPQPQRPMNQLNTQKSLISIIPGLQGIKERSEEGQCRIPRKPYLSEERSTEDMKAQIKFWARAVASNVRLEC